MIPGGAHTYAKGDDQYPADLAPVISHGSGAHVWDVDGNRYIEYGSGLRSVSHGAPPPPAAPAPPHTPPGGRLAGRGADDRSISACPPEAVVCSHGENAL
ncbi:hypothetical protein ACFXGX_29315, partial [Streptomyces sp. NPDC059371]